MTEHMTTAEIASELRQIRKGIAKLEARDSSSGWLLGFVTGALLTFGLMLMVMS
jgi:hypothetical protein